MLFRSGPGERAPLPPAGSVLKAFQLGPVTWITSHRKTAHGALPAKSSVLHLPWAGVYKCAVPRLSGVPFGASGGFEEMRSMYAASPVPPLRPLSEGERGRSDAGCRGGL